MKLFRIVVAAALLAFVLAGIEVAFAEFPAPMLAAGGVVAKKPLSVQLIGSIQMSGLSFPPGSATGTAVGTASVTMSPTNPVFHGSFSLSSAGGGDTTDFAINSTSGAVTTVTNNLCSSPPCSYVLNVVATQAGISNSPQSQTFTVVSSASGGTFAPSIATAFDDDAAGLMVTALWAGAPVPGSTSNVQTLNSCSASGWSAVQCAIYQYQGDTATAPYLSLTRALTSGDLGTHAVSVSGGGYSVNMTITVVQPQPTTPPSYVNNTAQGYFDNNTINSLRYDVQYQGPCGNGIVNPGFPVVIAFDLVDFTNASGCNMEDYHQAALGNYTSTWKASISAINAAVTGGITGIRIDNEWQGGGAPSTSCGGNPRSGPYTNNTGCGTGSGLVNPTDFVTAIENFADMIHANFPHIRVTFQGACDNNSDFNYWPVSLASHIDSAGVDWYFTPKYDGPSSTNDWITTTTPASNLVSSGHSGCGLATELAFAASRGKTFSVDEFCDEYPDGYNLTRTFYWLGPQYWERNGQWNSNDAIDTSYGTCQLDGSGDINSGASTAYHNMLGPPGPGTYAYSGPWTNY